MAKIHAFLLLLTLIFCSTGCRKEDAPAKNTSVTDQKVTDYLPATISGLYLVSGTYWIGGNTIITGVIANDTVTISPQNGTQVFFTAGFKEFAAANACTGDSFNCAMVAAPPNDSTYHPEFTNGAYYMFQQFANYPIYDDAALRAYFPKSNSDSIYITLTKMGCSCYPVFNFKGVKLR